MGALKRPAVLAVAAIVGLSLGSSLGWRRVPIQESPAAGTLSREPRTEFHPGSRNPAGTSSTSAPQVEPARGIAAAPRATWSAQKRLLSLVFQGWSKETRNKVLWNCFVGNYDAQRRLLDFLLASDNPAVWEAGRDFLIVNNTPGFVKTLLEAFAVESVPGRRAMLAYILGGNAGNPETHPVLFEMLTGGDAKVLQAVLPRLNMGAFDSASEYGDRIRAQLRELATSSPVPAIRTRAVWSLRGEDTADGARFLLGVALDTNAASEVRRAAIGSLPTTYDSHPPLVDEQLAGLWTLVRDESCDLKVRRAAADVLYNSSGKGMYRPTESDQALLKKLLDAK